MPLFGSRGAASVTGFGGLAKLGYLLRNSLRFRASNSNYLDRTFASAGNRKTYTLSLWLKRGILDGSTNQFFFGSGASATAGGFYFLPTNHLEVNPRVNNTNTYITTTQVFRDPSAWYHIVIALDTTQATDSNRLKLYVNGVQVTAFSATSYPALNGDSTLNNNIAHWIGRYPEPGFPSPFDGYLAEYNFIDGQALTPSSFGKTDSATGQWLPIKYAGTYGTNGFYLNFTDASAVTAAALGKDSSGNGNNWTPNNFSITAGSTYDSMTDVPTLTSATAANYCVLNPLDAYTNVTLSNANLSATFSAYTGFVRGTFALPSTGQWYWEGTVPTSDPRAEFGIATFSQAIGADPQTVAGCWIWYSNGTNSYKYNGSQVSWGTAWSSGDIIGIAFDAGAGTLTYYKNGSLQGGGAAFTGLTGTYAPMLGFGNNSSTAISMNFGQRPFQYSAPSGYKALNTYNLP